MQQLQIIYNKFNSLFCHLGEVVVAGGAVRDYLIGVTPKDYDIYIMRGHKEAEEPIIINTEIRTILASLKAETLEPMARNSNYPKAVEVVETIKTGNLIDKEFIPDPKNAQIMVTNYKNATELIGDFDWNICMFAFGANGVTAMEDIGNIGRGKTLRLNKMNFPTGNLRRGFRFSEKFQMKISNEDLAALTLAVYNDLTKNTTVATP